MVEATFDFLKFLFQENLGVAMLVLSTVIMLLKARKHVDKRNSYNLKQMLAFPSDLLSTLMVLGMHVLGWLLVFGVLRIQ